MLCLSPSLSKALQSVEKKMQRKKNRQITLTQLHFPSLRRFFLLLSLCPDTRSKIDETVDPWRTWLLSSSSSSPDDSPLDYYPPPSTTLFFSPGEECWAKQRQVSACGRCERGSPGGTGWGVVLGFGFHDTGTTWGFLANSSVIDRPPAINAAATHWAARGLFFKKTTANEDLKFAWLS